MKRCCTSYVMRETQMKTWRSHRCFCPGPAQRAASGLWQWPACSICRNRSRPAGWRLKVMNKALKLIKGAGCDKISVSGTVKAWSEAEGPSEGGTPVALPAARAWSGYFSRICVWDTELKCLPQASETIPLLQVVPSQWCQEDQHGLRC